MDKYPQQGGSPTAHHPVPPMNGTPAAGPVSDKRKRSPSPYATSAKRQRRSSSPPYHHQRHYDEEYRGRRRSYSRSNSRSPSPRYSGSGSRYRHERRGSPPRGAPPRGGNHYDYRYGRPYSRYHQYDDRFSRRRGGSPYRKRRSEQLPPAEPSTVVSVFNLDKVRTTEEVLRNFFSRYGKVEKVDLIKDRNVCSTNCSKGFAFIYFSNLEEAIQAKEKCHERELDGKIIRTDFSRTPRGHSPTPGKYLGQHQHHDRNRSHRY